MCIIAAKKANTAMPTTETIQNMWYANPDGAGFMYADSGAVHIEKGFMSLDAFTTRLDELGREIDLFKHSLVMHFRITTHGGTKPENCHPFPVSDNIPVLQKLRSKTKLGVVHNGIIPITTRNKTISDTMEYIASQLAPLHRFAPQFYKNKDAMLLVKNGIQSKMCFMDPIGNLYTVGDFIEDGGMVYSNTSYKNTYRSFRSYDFGAYGAWGDAWDGGWSTYNGKYSDYKPTKSSGKKLSTEPFVNDFGFYVQPKFLMPLHEVGGYCIDEEGEFLQDDDLFIDMDGNVWVYDWEMDTCFEFPGLIPYTSEGLPAKYKFDVAERMFCEVT